MPFPSAAFPDDVPVRSDGAVTIRPHTPDDATAIVEQCRDAETVRWMPVPQPYGPEDARAFVTETVPGGWRSGTLRAFAVEGPRSDGSHGFAGTIDLHDRGDRRAEVGFGAHPDARGTATIETGLRLVLAHAFEDLGLQALIWMAFQGNWASRKTVWKVGFTFGGTLQRWMDDRGTFRDAWTATLHHDDPRTPSTPFWHLPQLRSDRFLLRALEPQDLPRLVEGCNDPVTAAWISGIPHPYERAHAEAFRSDTLDEAAAGSAFSWAVVDATTDRFLGMAGYPRRTPTGAEIGYWLHPDARGRGVMTEVVERLVEHAFDPLAHGGLGVARVYLRIDAGNTASQAVARAAGFGRSGTERSASVRPDGTVADMLVLERVNPLLDGILGRAAG